MKKTIGILLTLFAILVILGVGYWLISPLFIETVANDPFPIVEPLESSSTGTPESQSESTEIVATEEELMKDYVNTSVEMDDPMPESENEGIELPEASHTGMFVDGVRSYTASGDVKVIGNILRFENLAVSNGPDLRVYLATDTTASDFIDIGGNKATKGSVNYALPEDIDLEKYDTVLIWCRAFSRLFGSAELS